MRKNQPHPGIIAQNAGFDNRIAECAASFLVRICSGLKSVKAANDTIINESID